MTDHTYPITTDDPLRVGDRIRSKWAAREPKEATVTAAGHTVTEFRWDGSTTEYDGVEYVRHNFVRLPREGEVRR